MSQCPSARYAKGVARGDWQDDPAQHPALAELDRLHDALVTREQASVFARLRARFMGETTVSGLYLWGGVGRGKTFLIDLFFDGLPLPHCRRVHFHRFMREIQAQLAALEGRADPLAEIAARIATEARVLCLDEFFVSDIGDAMILSGLLKHLFARGTSLVTTSNVAPAGLYRDGLQRERFLPAIALLECHCRVLELVSARDWRLRALTSANVYRTPAGPEAELMLTDCFQRIARNGEQAERELVLNERPIVVKRLAADVAWFDFDALCDGPRAVADYIELAKTFGTVLISNVPQFATSNDDPARRFIELVDEFYDRHVKLVLSAEVSIIDLYDGERLRAEFARTESRLIEMQSEAYLALEHRP